MLWTMIIYVHIDVLIVIVFKYLCFISIFKYLTNEF